MKRTMLGWKDSLRCRSTSSLNSCKARVFSPASSQSIIQIIDEPSLSLRPIGVSFDLQQTYVKAEVEKASL